MIAKGHITLFIVLALMALVLVLAACQATPTATPTKAPPTPTTPSLAAPSPTTAAAAPAVVATATRPPVAPASAPPTPTEKATSKGKIVLAISSEPSNMDTLLQTIGPDTRHIYPSVMEYLMQRDWKTFDLSGLLAEKWEQVKPDTWRYTLKKGIKFHNGEPFNADAVVFSLGKIADKDSGAQLQRYWPAGGKVVKVDDFTVELTSSTADPIQPLRLLYLPSVPPKWARENPEERPVKLIGTGPYKFVEWVRGQYVKVTANDDYWATPPNIKDATFVWRPEASVRAAMLRTGEADFAVDLTPEDAQKVPKYTATTSVETTAIRYDQQSNPVVKDKRVRLAMNLAFDKNLLVEKLFSGFAEPAKGQIFGEYVLGFNPNLKAYPFDVEQAKKLLAEAKAAGIPWETTELDMWISKGRLPRIEEMGESLADSWNKLGMKVKVYVAEQAKWRDAAQYALGPGQKRVALTVWPHGNDLGDSGQTADYVRCGGRLSAFCDAALDAKINQAAEATGEQRVKLYQEFWKLMYEEYVPHIPLFRLKPIYGLSKRLAFTPRMDDLAPVQEMKLLE